MNEIISSIGLGPALSIAGLCLDGIGVIVSLWSYVFQTDKDVAIETEAILTADWSHDQTQAEWLNTGVGRVKLKQRRLARLGLICLATGFFLQAIGNYIWASS